MPTPSVGRKFPAFTVLVHRNKFPHRRKITIHGALHLPDWLQSISYADPVGIIPTAWSSTLNIGDKHPYGWLGENS